LAAHSWRNVGATLPFGHVVEQVRTYAKVFQQGKAPKTVHRVRHGAWTPLGRFCV